MKEIIKSKNKVKSSSSSGKIDEDVQMLEVLVMQAKSEDHLFFKTGVEEDQFNKSVADLKLGSDLEFKKIYTEGQREIDAAMMEQIDEKDKIYLKDL